MTKKYKKPLIKKMKEEGWSYWQRWSILHLPSRDKGVRETCREIKRATKLLKK